MGGEAWASVALGLLTSIDATWLGMFIVAGTVPTSSSHRMTMNALDRMMLHELGSI